MLKRLGSGIASALGAFLLLSIFLFLRDDVRLWLPEHVTGVRSVLYAAVAGAAGTLAGFALAALTFVASLPTDTPLLQRLRARGDQDGLMQAFGRATCYFSLLLVVALAGIVVDQEPKRGSPPAGVDANWIWLTAFLAFAGGASLAQAVARLTGFLPVIAASRRGRTPRQSPPTG